MNISSSFSQNIVMGTANASFLPTRGEIPNCGWGNQQPVDSYQPGGQLGLLARVLLGDEMAGMLEGLLRLFQGGPPQQENSWGGPPEGAQRPCAGRVKHDPKGCRRADTPGRGEGLDSPKLRGSLSWPAPQPGPPAAPALAFRGLQVAAPAAPAFGTVVQQQVNTNVTNVTNNVTINKGSQPFLVNGQIAFETETGKIAKAEPGMGRMLEWDAPRTAPQYDGAGNLLYDNRTNGIKVAASGIQGCPGIRPWAEPRMLSWSKAAKADHFSP